MAVRIERRIAGLVQGFVRERAADQGLGDLSVDLSTDIFGLGLIDSMSLTELVLLVEETLGVEIDFTLVDPDALRSLDGLVGQLVDTAMAPAS